MKLTRRQRFLLANLHRIISRRKMSGRSGFFLAQDDCTTTINSLIVKRVIAKTPDGQRVRPTGEVDLAGLDILPVPGGVNESRRGERKIMETALT